MNARRSAYVPFDFPDVDPTGESFLRSNSIGTLRDRLEKQTAWRHEGEGETLTCR